MVSLSGSNCNVSTHSRPKAAGRAEQMPSAKVSGFNTQPPEGGWHHEQEKIQAAPRFNTQPPEGGWFFLRQIVPICFGFNTQPPEGGWLQKRSDIISTTKFQHTAARRRLGMSRRFLI